MGAKTQKIIILSDRNRLKHVHVGSRSLPSFAVLGGAWE